MPPQQGPFHFLFFNGVILCKRPYIKRQERRQIAQFHSRQRRDNAMWRLFKLLFFLSILAAAAFVAYAYVGPIFFPADFAPPTAQVSQPLVLQTQ